MNIFPVAFTILLTILGYYKTSNVFARDIKKLELFNMSITLPNYSTNTINPQLRNLLHQISNFTSTYHRKIQKLRSKQNDKSKRDLKVNYLNDWTNLRSKLNGFQTRSLNDPLLGQNTIFEKLTEFMALISSLPFKIHCLIYPCAGGSGIGSVEPTKPGSVVSNPTSANGNGDSESTAYPGGGDGEAGGAAEGGEE